MMFSFEYTPTINVDVANNQTIWPFTYSLISPTIGMMSILIKSPFFESKGLFVSIKGYGVIVMDSDDNGNELSNPDDSA